MITTKTINNQNAVINAILGTDDHSTTTINGNVLIQDSIGNSLTITPTGTIPATNTTFNNIIVNGTSNFNQLALMNLGGRVYSVPDPRAGWSSDIRAKGGLTAAHPRGCNVPHDQWAYRP